MKESVKRNKLSFTALFIGPALVLSLILASACKRPAPDSHRADAADLYIKSVRLIKLYSDSFAMAQDSATLLEMNSRFEHDLTALNFKYPSETCLEISEGENDTLTNLTERLIELRDSALYRFAHPLAVADSLANDSISSVSPVK